MKKLKYTGYTFESESCPGATKFWDWLFDKVIENRKKSQLTKGNKKNYYVDNSYKPLPLKGETL